MKRILFIFWLMNFYKVSAQRFSVFEDIAFDSSYSVAATSSSFHYNADSSKYSFLVTDIKELSKMKTEWEVKKIRPKISIEENIIRIFVIKDRQLVNSSVVIYPEQGIIKARNNWYEFDMEKFTTIQSANPFNYRSQFFEFETHLKFALFNDSIQDTPFFLFLLPPFVEYEGHFDIIASRSADNDSPIFVLSDLNKELARKAGSQKFNASLVMNDSFNLEQTKKVLIKVQCAKSLYDAYNKKFREKGKWEPSTYDARVFFKE
jgi:hypothetical protein